MTTTARRFGVRRVGVRARYYSDNGEDALIMTTEPLGSPYMRTRLAEMTERYGGHRGGPRTSRPASA